MSGNSEETKDVINWQKSTGSHSKMICDCGSVLFRVTSNDDRSIILLSCENCCNSYDINEIIKVNK